MPFVLENHRGIQVLSCRLRHCVDVELILAFTSGFNLLVGDHIYSRSWAADELLRCDILKEQRTRENKLLHTFFAKPFRFLLCERRMLDQVRWFKSGIYISLRRTWFSSLVSSSLPRWRLNANYLQWHWLRLILLNWLKTALWLKTIFFLNHTGIQHCLSFSLLCWWEDKWDYFPNICVTCNKVNKVDITADKLCLTQKISNYEFLLK